MSFVLLSDRVPGLNQLTSSLLSSYKTMDRFTSNEDIDLFFSENNLSNLTYFAFLYDNNNNFMSFFPSDDMYFGTMFSYFISKLVTLNNDIIVDIITCNIDNIDDINNLISIQSQYNVKIRYSLDETGNYNSGGDWIQESDNVNIKPIYFNDNINNWNYTLYLGFYSNQSQKLI